MSHVNVEMVSETSIISGKDMQSLLSLLVHSFIQTTVDSIVFIFSGPREAVTEFMWGTLVAKDSTSWIMGYQVTVKKHLDGTDLHLTSSCVPW